MKKYEKFYLKTLDEKINILKSENLYDEFYDKNLNINDASLLSENVITTYELPFGVVPNFKVDNTNYVIPIVTEEASVVAALNHAAKLTYEIGFKTEILGTNKIGQIFFNLDVDFEKLSFFIENNKENIFKQAQISHPSIYKRGGGVSSFYLKKYQKDMQTYTILYVEVNTLEAMGANIVNTILEGLKKYFTSSGFEVLMAILSNHATSSLVTSRCFIPIESLKGKIETANKILLATDFANLDIYRATTHNKGVLNGISGFFLATGNDTRSIEAAAHSYASINHYKPLTKWKIENKYLIGEITIPCQIGSISKQLNVLNKANLARKLMNFPNAKKMMSITASIGLAQNFSALYALVSDGIQKGHMKLHNRLNKEK